MRKILFLLLIAFNGFAQPEFSSNTEQDVHYIQQSYDRLHKVNAEIRNRFAVNSINGNEYVSFLTKRSASFNANELINNGVLIGAQINDIVSIKYPLDNVTSILSNSNFSYVHLANKVKPLLDRVVIGTRVDSVWAGIGLPQGYSGKNVIIGITDWGFDYSSPMFYDTLLQDTRILAAWDQFKTSGPTPTGYSYGTEYTTPAEFVTAGSDTANIYSYHTHGTHVAGIAGGSGAGTKYRGMAFECEYLFTTFLVDESAVLDAWQWMYDKAQAAGKRLVVNMSWGLYHMDAIDGTAIISQALDAFSDQGVIFVTSAGNNGGVNFHIKKDFNNDTITSRINFYVNPSLPTVWGQSIHMWGEPGNTIDASLLVYETSSGQVVAQSPWYSTSTLSSYVDSFLVTPLTDTIWFNLSADNTYPTNGRPQIRLRVKYPPSGYSIVMASAAATGTVHYWNVTELSNDVGNWGMQLSSYGDYPTAGDHNYGIGTPACSNSAISVAAYNSEFLSPSGNEVGGAPSTFSSYGPLMTDSLKPDISAPGVNVTSSISSYTDADYTPITSVTFNGRTYPFANFSGTSMSSPATAGVVALILDANPYLSAKQIKEIIISTARTDNYTGAIPPFSTFWGWGKVNAYAAVQLALITDGLVEIEQELAWTVYPNPTSENITISGIDSGIEHVEIINLQGEKVLNARDMKVDVSSLKPGTYLVRIIINGKVQQQKFIKH